MAQTGNAIASFSERKDSLVAPRTKEEALYQTRVIWLSLLVSMLLYVYIGETTPDLSWLHFLTSGKTLIALSILCLFNFLLFWHKRYSQALHAVQTEPENIRLIKRWMNYWVILVCLAESEALFGLALRLGGKRLQQALPLYLVALLLMLCLWPRKFWSSTGAGVR